MKWDVSEEFDNYDKLITVILMPNVHIQGSDTACCFIERNDGGDPKAFAQAINEGLGEVCASEEDDKGVIRIEFQRNNVREGHIVLLQILRELAIPYSFQHITRFNCTPRAQSDFVSRTDAE